MALILKDRVKESIFNSISPYLHGSKVLDLFGGSGSLGIEAISRGSEFCEFVDVNNIACKTMKENIKNLKIEDKTTVIQSNYEDYLKSCTKKFDIILLDPPYQLEVLDDIINLIQSYKLLDDNGIIVCLYGKNYSLKEDINGIIEYKQKNIGITKVSFMKWGI